MTPMTHGPRTDPPSLGAAGRERAQRDGVAALVALTQDTAQPTSLPAVKERQRVIKEYQKKDQPHAAAAGSRDSEPGVSRTHRYSRPRGEVRMAAAQATPGALAASYDLP